MKRFNMKYLISLMMVLPLLMSCEKESEGLSFITHYIIITPEGGDVLMSTGETFSDPGYTAFEGEEDVTANVVVTDNIDNTVAGFYTVTYTATNADGYSSSTTRTVIVQSTADYATTLDGVYYASVARDGVPAYDGLSFTIKDNVLQCAIGGYYSVGRNYGTDYAALGAEVSVSDLSATTATMPAWGYTVEVSDMVADATTGTISWDGTASFGAVFSVTLERIK